MAKCFVIDWEARVLIESEDGYVCLSADLEALQAKFDRLAKHCKDQVFHCNKAMAEKNAKLTKLELMLHKMGGSISE